MTVLRRAQKRLGGFGCCALIWLCGIAAALPASAREQLPPANLMPWAATPPAGSAHSMLNAADFAGYVPERRIAVLRFDEIGDPRQRHAGELRQIVERQLGRSLPDDSAAETELRAQAIAAYEDYGGAYVREFADGSQYCVAAVWRPIGGDGRILAALAGGAPMGGGLRPDFVIPEDGIQRFLAYHEIGGHCADRALQPATGSDFTSRAAYEHSLAELRADIVATLATARDDGNTAVAQMMLELRRAYSLQAAIAPSCDKAINYGAIYRTGPGIAAAMVWAESALAPGAARASTLGGMSTTAMLAAADRIFAAVRPSYDAFLEFERRIDLAKTLIGSPDPFDLAGKGPSLDVLSVSDRLWLGNGIDAMRRIFTLPEVRVVDLGATLHCHPGAALARRMPAGMRDGHRPSLGGLGG
jgi:hypothetical protein